MTSSDWAVLSRKSVSLHDHVLLRELEGESVLLNLESSHYFGLDDVGTRMLDVLHQVETVGAAFDLLLSEYEVDSEQLRSDLSTFIQELETQGLLEVKGGG